MLFDKLSGDLEGSIVYIMHREVSELRIRAFLKLPKERSRTAIMEIANPAKCRLVFLSIGGGKDLRRLAFQEREVLIVLKPVRYLTDLVAGFVKS